MGCQIVGRRVRQAIANATVSPQLVNGVVLRKADGTVWLCEVLTQPSPLACSEPSLLVQNMAAGDQTFVTGDRLRIADGVQWVEGVQFFGVVRPTGRAASS
jgi:hypothetical protein